MKKDSLDFVKDSISLKDTITLAGQKKHIIEAIKPENVKEGVAERVSELSVYFEKIIAMSLNAIPDLFRGFIFLVVGLFVIRTVLKIVKIRFEKRNLDISLRGFLISIIKFILYILLVLSVAANLGFQMTAILGALSGLVLAVGLALQGSLSNFAGGVLILLFRPFEVNDYIENNLGTEGTVEKIDLLYTSVRNSSGILIFSPNGALANSVIRNFSKITNRRFEYIIGISYNDNIGTARNVIFNILANDVRVLKTPAPDVFVNELAESTVNLIVRGWASKDNYWETRNSLQEDIKNALDKAGIDMANPQQDIHIVSDKRK